MYFNTGLNKNTDYLFCAIAAYFNVKHYMTLLVLQHHKIFRPSSFNNVLININIIISIIGELCINGSFALLMAITHCIRYTLFTKLNSRINKILLEADSQDKNKNILSRWKYSLLSRYCGYFLIGIIPICDKLIISQGNTGYLSGYNICERIFLLPISIIISPIINRFIPIIETV